MKSVLLCLLFNVFSLADLAVWKDPNGVEWTSPVRTSFYRAADRCKRLAFRLPSADDFWEALDHGLSDPEVNTAFGEAAIQVDWIWVKGQASTPSFRTIASRWGDVAPEIVDARHWVLCSRR